MRLRSVSVLLAFGASVACARADAASHDRAAEGPRAPVSPASEDSALFARTVAWAQAERLDTLGFGDLIVAVGRRFLGAPYIAGSLDPPGPERLIVNLRAFDCVTYVESVLALAHVIRDGVEPTDFARFRDRLGGLRYRDAGIVAYTNRLHYFSEWIATNESRGWVTDITAQLGGEPDRRPIGFMTAHPSAYPQLADSAALTAIRQVERALAGRTRYRIPEASIAAVADGILPGDVIAATSNLAGLDIAHTGIAVRVNGILHLMHAPLAGGVVEVSELPLADRIQRIGGQDGIMVARPR